MSIRKEYSWAGLAAGAGAWAANTKIGYAVAQGVCAKGPLLIIIDGMLAGCALGGATVSYFAVRAKQEARSQALWRAHSLIGSLGMWSGALLGVVIITQGAAILTLQHCRP